MKATTIKLDGELLEEIERVKAPDQSVTSFVRYTLKSSIKRMKLRESAEAYVALKETGGEEDAWLQEWREKDLASAPKPRKKIRRSKS
ncbi:MAG: hypothetical protein KJ626_15440 [Verrucomicrobia bacterium]|nr:hypothetical protein [Verrucomicrobiota bacterium]